MCLTEQGDNKIAAPTEVLAIEYKKEPEVKEEHPPSPPPPEPVKEPVKEEPPIVEPPDLLVIPGTFIPHITCLFFQGN